MEICIIWSLKGEYGSNCIASWSEFARNIGKIQQRAICVFYKSWSGFFKRTLWVNPYYPWFKLKQKQNKLLMEIIKESLRGKYGSDCYCCIFCLMKMLWKGNMDQTVLSFMIFCHILVIKNWVNSADDMVQGVQMDNLFHKDNTGWNNAKNLILICNFV